MHLGQRVSDPCSACHHWLTSNHLVGVAVAWVASLVYDLLIFVLTLCKTYRQRSRFAGHGGNGIMALIMRDGKDLSRDSPALLELTQCHHTGAMYFG